MIPITTETSHKQPKHQAKDKGARKSENTQQYITIKIHPISNSWLKLNLRLQKEKAKPQQSLVIVERERESSTGNWKDLVGEERILKLE